MGREGGRKREEGKVDERKRRQCLDRIKKKLSKITTADKKLSEDRSSTLF